MNCLRCHLPIESEGFALNHMSERVCLDVALAHIKELENFDVRYDKDKEQIRMEVDVLFKYAEQWKADSRHYIQQLKEEIEGYRAAIVVLQAELEKKTKPVETKAAKKK